MNLKTPLSREYWLALQVSLVFQGFFGLMSGLMLDGGLVFQFWCFSFLSYWGGFAMIIARRPLNPTKVDLFLIRWGFLFLDFLIVPLFSVTIWRARGVWPP